MPIERPSGACSSSHCPLFVKVGRSDGKKKKKNIQKRKRNTHNSDVRFIMENGEASDVPLACVAWRFCREQD